MTTPPIVSITDELIAELDEECKSSVDIYLGRGLVRALLAERAELKRDAERWRMMVIIADEVTVAPDHRKNQAALSAYMGAVSSGLYLAGAIDAAIDAAMP